MVTSYFFVILTPWSQNIRSLSERENQNSSSAILNKTGSFSIPPLSLHKIAYFPLPGSILVASLVITKSVKASASGPLTLICLSTATFHIVTRLTNASYSTMAPPSSGFT